MMCECIHLYTNKTVYFYVDLIIHLFKTSVEYRYIPECELYAINSSKRYGYEKWNDIILFTNFWDPFLCLQSIVLASWSGLATAVEPLPCKSITSSTSHTWVKLASTHSPNILTSKVLSVGHTRHDIGELWIKAQWDLLRDWYYCKC